MQMLEQIGIDNNFIDLALQKLDTPKAKVLQGLAGMAGVDIGDAKRQLASLKTYDVPKSTDDSLASLKNGLQRRK